MKLVRVDGTEAVEVLRFYPLTDARAPLPPGVPPHLASDYTEACRLLPTSEKASAALGRRCLQGVLREAARVKPGKLSAEIEAVVKANVLPSHISDDLHSVREIGNLAAHPVKNEQTGRIVDVEPHEAEWLLNVLEELFQWFYVELPRRQARRDSLNRKLAEAGKQPVSAL